jgi:probable HAF family extracellular repeat protein
MPVLLQTLRARLVAATLLGAAAAAQAADYRLTDLGTLPRGDLSRATAIGPDGRVYGQSSDAPQTYQMRPVVFHGGEVRRLLRGTDAARAVGTAVAVDAQGAIAGTLSLEHGPVAYRLHGAVLEQLAPRHGWALALGMSPGGLVVGQARLDGGSMTGFQWGGGAPVALPGPVPTRASAALGAQDGGLVVGWADLSGGPQARRVAYAWRDGVAVGELPGFGGHWSEATAVNAHGAVVGHSTLTDRYDRHAFLYQGGQLLDLDGDPASISEAWAINGRGEVVGWRARGGRDAAFLYRQGRMQRLDALLPAAQRAVWTVDRAHAIDDQGRIVGEAVHPTRGRHAVLLTPVQPR